jgi:hypothetical protein
MQNGTVAFLIMFIILNNNFNLWKKVISYKIYGYIKKNRTYTIDLKGILIVDIRLYMR